MNTMKLLRTSLRKHVWDVISLQRFLVVFLIAFVLAMFSDMVMWHGKKTCTTPISDMQFILFLILMQIIFIITTHNVYFPDALEQNFDTPEPKKEFSSKLMTMACGILTFMSMIFIWIMFSEYMLKLVSSWLGTECDRAATLSSIGYGMGGVLAVIGAIAINRRANADVENNKLTEKGLDNGRFQNITTDLGNQNAAVRVASFYRFYYLALKEKEKKKNKKLAQDIFEILCSYLRIMPIKEHNSKQEKCKNVNLNEKHDSKNHDPEKRTIPENDEFYKERQTLCNVLFKGKFKGKDRPKHEIENKDPLIPKTFPADLQHVYLAYMDLSSANLSHVDFSYADLSHAYLLRADILHAIFSYANLSDSKFRLANLTGANLANANLANANLANAKLVNANLRGSSLTNARLGHADLTNAKLRRANLEGAYLTYANLTNANLLRANLTKTYLGLANFSNADLSNANLSDAYLPKANFSGADFSGANLSNATFSTKYFVRLDAPGANLSDTDFSGADLSNANFIGAQLKDAKLQNVRSIEGANFLYAKIGDEYISPEDLPTDKGKYTAAWTNDEFWAEVEKNKKS